MLNAYVADDPAALIRIVAGTLVFSVSFSTANQTAQQLLAERFNGNLKLIITAPVSKFAYVAGTLVHSSMVGAGSVVAILVFAAASGIDADLTWTFLPIILLAVLFLAGLTLFTISFAPNLMVGSMLANIMGIILAMVSPVFFTMEQAPLLLRWLGYGLAPEVRGRWLVGLAHRPNRRDGRSCRACRVRTWHHGPRTLETTVEREVEELRPAEGAQPLS